MKNEQTKTKVVVIGGTGLVGSKVVTKLNEQGYDVVSASPNSGVNTITGEGLNEVLEGARVVIDVSNSPSFEEAAATDFFTKSTTNIPAGAAQLGTTRLVDWLAVPANVNPPQKTDSKSATSAR